MNKISEDLSQKQIQNYSAGKHYLLMKKKRYGNYAAHMFFLFVELFIFMPLLIANVVYLAYSLLWTSPNVLITTETKARNLENLLNSILLMKYWKKLMQCFNLNL